MSVMRRIILLIFIACLAGLGPVCSAASQQPEATPKPQLPEILVGDGILILVNRDNRISKTYVPEDLALPRVETRKESLKDNILLRQEAALALEKMFQAAMNEGSHTLFAASGYRSFGIQQILFNSKVEEVGSKAKAQYRVAPPGTSEHQLGLAIDIQSPSQLNLNPRFGDTPEGIWAGENAHRFGFILRYKTAWRDITGISDEPWHFRYVGVAHATAMHLLDVPLETYVAYAQQLPGYVLTGGSHVLLAGLIGDFIAQRQPEHLIALQDTKPADRESALRLATAPYLKDGQTYEQALWYAYPTPKPTAEPWYDRDDEEIELSGGLGGM